MRRAALTFPVLAAFAALPACTVDGASEPPTSEQADLIGGTALGGILSGLPACSLRSAPKVLLNYAGPSIDPTSCVDRAPKVALVRVANLPKRLRDQLGFGFSTEMLLYVPGADSSGKRVVTLNDAPPGDVDPCPARVKAGSPTEEKCPAPTDATRAAMATKLPGVTDKDISLASRSISGRLADGSVSMRSYRGVVVVADEVRVSGTARTWGNDLVIVTNRLTGGGTIDVTPARPTPEVGPTDGARLVVAAASVEGGVSLVSRGSPGPLPRSWALGLPAHPDCDRYVGGDPAVLDGGTCWKCVGAYSVWAAPPDASAISAVPGPGTCFASTPSSAQALSSQFFKDAHIPWAYTQAPSGSPGGASTAPRPLIHKSSSDLSLLSGPGRGSHGLAGYSYRWEDWSVCNQGAPQCFGVDHDKTVYAGNSYDGSMTTSMTYRRASAPSDFPTHGALEVYELMAYASDELVTPGVHLAAADAAFRAGDRTTAKARYTAALDALGPTADDYPCTLADLYASHVAEANGAIKKLDAALDYGGLQSNIVPFKSPAALHDFAKSEILHTKLVAVDMSLASLLSYASTAAAAAIATNMNQADGELATAESSMNTFALAEKNARLAEVNAYATGADANLVALTKRLKDYNTAKSVPPSDGIFDKIKNVVTKGAAVAADVAAIVGSSGLALAGGLAKGAADAADLYKALDTFGDTVTPWSCDSDPVCVALVNDVRQAKFRVAAIQEALAGAHAAVAAQLAAADLFEARRRASADVGRTLSGGVYVLSDPSKLARGAKYLCQYGSWLADESAKTLYEYERASAMWDVPTPADDVAAYHAAGGSYAYGFSKLFEATCVPPSCSLWGELDAFDKVRVGPPNNATLFLGTADVPTAKQVASLLRGSPVGVGGRAAIALGLFRAGGETRFGVRPTLDAAASGADTTVYDSATSFVGKWGVQLIGLNVRAYGSDGTATRVTFPFRLSRAASDAFTNDTTSGATIGFAMRALPTLELDGGQWLTRPTPTQGTGFDFRIVDVKTPADVVEHPESLLKPWTLWVKVCGPGEIPGAACASAAELALLDRVEIQASIRYKASP